VRRASAVVGVAEATALHLLLLPHWQILLDGTNIKELNVGWLREQFGLVSQEPDLFADTLEYNISYGKPDSAVEPCDPRNPPTTAKSSTGDVVDGRITVCACGWLAG
jgi:ATP-binding cassette subfamily B (MDR/TAP) protein 1